LHGGAAAKGVEADLRRHDGVRTTCRDIGSSAFGGWAAIHAYVAMARWRAEGVDADLRRDDGRHRPSAALNAG
jgi:hypothetical protein